MAKNEFVLNIGDDNVVLTRFTDGQVANAWLGSPDPAMAQEELGEALAEDPKARISVIVDTLDQSFKEEEIPKVGILDRRKVLARHINMAFPGANMRGARLVRETDKKTLIYEFAAIPLDGRIPGWLDFIAALPHEKGGIHALASENVDIIQRLLPQESEPEEAETVEEGRSRWRHLIGVNVTGGLRQIIEKNGRLCLTRLTQAPPEDTPPDEFADMIVRDFKATITYIRRLGYQVGDRLDLVVLTTPANKAVLQDLDWEGARSATVYTPYEAGALLGLGSLGKEDQAYCDVLHAAWFSSKRKSLLPLTRAAALGDTKDDLRELAYAASPYLAGLLTAAVLGWAGWTLYEYLGISGVNETLQAQLVRLKSEETAAHADAAKMPYDVTRVRNVIDVATALDTGKVDLVPILQNLAGGLEADAVVMDIKYLTGDAAKPENRRTAGGAAAAALPAGATATKGPIAYAVEINCQLAPVISKAEEAVATARKIEQRLKTKFGKGYNVVMTTEPVGAQAKDKLSGGFSGVGETAVLGPTTEKFHAAYRIEKAGS